ncbi:STAS/SEC14 domain-containing protein [Alkalihalophilus pseudofirmus]|uniref:STAS/SEC14 domain-containing protein n=1 Tax=Alkalihalophilus pseudofirmus TaxID=79885 RepID=A0AAJ2L0U5_ALKPS|nr:STAS/SEC14 domain-containing protein [Alkalihalophilus pseudofirmus]MDV2884475.1 STAS/SEC14 domain-containing protein [Alkalihalophilus pseudofirmus]
MIRKLSTSTENIIEYEVDDTLTDEENKEVLDELKTVINQYGKIKILVRLNEMAGVELSAIDDRLAFAKEHLSDIEKYAIVSDGNLTEYISKLADKMTQMDMRHFAKDEEKMARSWIRD